MLSTAEWSRLGGLLFVARRLVEGLYAGRHASSRYGPGLEFHDYRSYCPGDDLADVDWKLLGRTDRVYVRRYQQLTDLHAYLMVDCSASMHFAGLDRRGRALTGPEHVTKLSYSQSLAAAIAYLAIRQSDRAGLGLYADRLLDHLPPAGTWSHLRQICRRLEEAQPVRRPGDLGRSLVQAHAQMRRRGLLVLIGDLLDEPASLFEGLARFRHDRFDAVIFQVLTPQELDLNDLHRLRLQMVDSETRKAVRTDISRVHHRYRQLIAEHVDTLRRGCAARGVEYNLLTTDEPIVTALRRYLVRRSAGR